MKCQDLMKMELEWIPGTATVLEAARMMRDRSVGLLLVSKPVAGRTIGVLTVGDLAVRVCAEELSVADTRVGAIATHDVVTCQGEEDLRVAEERMLRAKKSRLVVLDGTDKVVGILSLEDILREDRAVSGAHAGSVADAPHEPGEGIFLTPSTVEDEETTANRPHSVTMGAHRGSMKEFPA